MNNRERIAKLAALGMECHWPRCDCRTKRDFWAAEAGRLADPTQPIPTQAELDMLQVEATLVLACMSKRCADRLERYTASLTLLCPVFDVEHFEAAMARLVAAEDAAEAEAKRSEDFFCDPPAMPDGEGSLLGTWPHRADRERNKRIAKERERNLREVPKPKDKLQ
jgi:hypothetical protein